MNKIVEIKGLEIYSSTINVDVLQDSLQDSILQSDTRFEGNESNHILEPFDVSVSLSVCV